MSDGPPTVPRIGDYAVIGDCRSAALVSTGGGLDWLCWPRFDSPALFAGILDPSTGGTWSVGPAARQYRVHRRYVGSTAVLETRFTTESGVLALRDFMPVATEARKRRELWPEHQVLRRIECVEGALEVEERLAPRPGFGRRQVRVRDRRRAGLLLDLGRHVLAYRSDLPHRLEDGEVRARARLERGDVRWSSLTFASSGPAYLAPLGETAERRLEETLAWWGEWSGKLRCPGPYREMMVRSAITLKLLTYAPTGAVVAAPTTSLPESIGGARNWDYRYCWLRDAGMTVRAFYALGCGEEGDAFASWILHATRLTWPEIRVLYDVYGNPPPAERALEHLDGFRGSRPVRVGNGARDQLQLDVYGEVVGAVTEHLARGGTLDRSSRRFLRGIARTVGRRWSEPDSGIWEVRSERRHHTNSRVRCWSALNDLLLLDGASGLGLARRRLVAVRDRIRSAIEAEGWSESLGSYVSFSGGDAVDASLLLLAEHGYVDARNRARFVSTLRTIERELSVGPLVFRYRHADGLKGAEGAFGICSFWLVMALVAAGERERARVNFEQLLARANDVGLYGEEIDTDTGEALGNFPQAFTHVGLIHAALALYDGPREERD